MALTEIKKKYLGKPTPKESQDFGHTKSYDTCHATYASGARLNQKESL